MDEFELREIAEAQRFLHEVQTTTTLLDDTPTYNKPLVIARHLAQGKIRIAWRIFRSPVKNGASLGEGLKAVWLATYGR